MTLLTYDFTGTNGDPWPSPWGNTVGTVQIQNNRGRLQKPAQSYGAGAADHGTSQNDSYTDVEVSGTVWFSILNNDAFFSIVCRAATGNRYEIIMQPPNSSIQLRRQVNGTDTVIPSSASSRTFSTNTGTSFRFRVEGTTLSYKWWNAGDSEPGSWNISLTDTNVTQSGIVGTYYYDASTSAEYAELDDLEIDDLSVPNVTYDETMRPNAALQLTNLSGAYTDIDDDPDTPDASWLTAP